MPQNIDYGHDTMAASLSCWG